MHLLQVLYALSGIIALSAGGFQLAKLLKTKNSDEFNLGTWLMWTGTQTVSTTYALVIIGDPLYIAISGGWATFYLTMSVLIIRYSSSPQTLFKSVGPIHRPTKAALPIEVAPDNAKLALEPEPLK